MATNVVMPQLGESVIEGTVGKWLKAVGDKVEQYEPIMEVVTDKVNTEIPSPAAGTLLSILVPDGATVNAGTVLAVIGAEGEKAPAVPAHTPQAEAERSREPSEATMTPATIADQSAQPPTPAAHAPVPHQQQPEKGDGASQRLTPVVARMISEYNITADELKTIQGTGESGRVSRKDLERFLAQRLKAPAPAAVAEPELMPWEQPGSGDLFKPTEDSFGKVQKRAAPPPAAKPAPPAPAPQAKPAAGPMPGAREELVPLSVMRKSIAEHMLRSVHTAPHVTTIHEADMTRVIAHLRAHEAEFQQQGAKLTYTAYLVEAAVAALRAVPLVNAQYTDEGILLKRYINLGIAVAIPDGLIVPVLKNADEKNLLGIARAVNDLAQRARDKRLAPDEVQSGTFTITNYGVFGSLFGTPIISQPQSAILGVGAIQKRAVVINDAIAIRPMAFLGLTFDHRLLDGASGDQFMNAYKKFLTEYPD